MHNTKPDYCIQPLGITAIRTSSGTLFPINRIYCVGQNYAAHTHEMGGNPDKDLPLFFCKPADAAIQDGTVPYPPATTDLHHEVELVVALKRGGANLSLEEAAQCVYGYAVGVDLTRRDLQLVAKERGEPWDMAKAFDNSAPISELVPVSDAGDPGTAAIKLAVNGQLRQSGSTAQMIWSVSGIISTLSRFVRLQAGDLIFTGTPEGVGPLDRGDQVTANISGLPQLQFQII